MKKIQIYTALWNVDTKIAERGRPANALRNFTPMGRYNLLDYVVREAWLDMVERRMANFETMLAQHIDWLYLFVAPEYYFAASDSAHAIPQNAKQTIVGMLQVLSGRFSNLVLVPGTIAWKKPVLRRGPEVFQRNTTNLKERGRMEKFLERSKTAIDDHAALIPHAVDLWIADRVRDADGDRSEIRRLQGPDYRRVRTQILEDELDLRRQATSRMITNLQQQQDRCYIARNTAYAFRAGREVARYHKRGDYFEVFPSESDNGYVIYEPGGGPEGPGDRFTVESVKFGVEVCLDHQLGFLSQHGGYYPDVQVIMSAAAQFIPDHAFVTHGGYIVHASSESDNTAIYFNDRGRIRNVATTNVPTLVGELRYATLELEVNDGPVIIDDYTGNNV